MAAMLALALGFIATPGFAQSSFSSDDPPIARSGFITVPQVIGRGYTLNASVVSRVDSNFQRTGGTGTSAVRITPLVQAGIGTLLGRQQVYVGGSLGQDVFIDNSQFNRTQFQVGGGAGLYLGSRCSFNVGTQYGQRQLLQNDAVELADNLIKDFVAGGGFLCRGPVGIGFGTDVVYRTVRNGRSQRALFDFDSLTISPQLSYASRLGVFSLGANFSNFKYPNRPILTPDGFFEDELDVRSLRIGYSRPLGSRLQLSVGLSDFSTTPRPDTQLLPDPVGPPGSLISEPRTSAGGLGYDGTLTAQLGSRASISISADRSFRGGGNVGALQTRAVNWGVDGDYRLTRSIAVGAGARFSDLDFIDSFASPDEPQARRSSKIQRYYGQINYSPTPRYSVGLEVAHLRRESDPEIFAFENTSVLLSMRVQFGRSG
ncbi:MAG: hypothetical protein ACMVO5_03895 [Polymorphobacter sp.]|uniref:hypothetical protein n=1 Tax=Polymorphobacter sp. TaxID=1909290 RepID=UPI003A89AAC5